MRDILLWAWDWSRAREGRRLAFLLGQVSQRLTGGNRPNLVCTVYHVNQPLSSVWFVPRAERRGRPLEGRQGSATAAEIWIAYQPTVRDCKSEWSTLCRLPWYCQIHKLPGRRQRDLHCSIAGPRQRCAELCTAARSAAVPLNQPASIVIRCRRVVRLQ